MEPLSILLLNPFRVMGGGEKWIINLGRGLKERGHHVLIGVREGAELIDEAKDEGLECLALKMRNDLDPVSIAQIIKKVRERRINVILTTSVRDLWIGGVAAHLAGLGGVIARCSLWDPSRSHWKRDLKYWRRRLIYNTLAKKVVTNSEAGKVDMVQSGWIAPEKVEIIYNGVDLRRFSSNGNPGKIREEFSIEPDGPLIVSIARLVSEHGQIYIIQAAEEILREFPTAKFMLVGKEGEEKDLRELREARPHLLQQGSIIFTGFRQDVEDILEDTDIFVIASLKEGLPNVVLEAMAMKKPVVATNICGIPEAVQDGLNGFLIPPQDTFALVSSITRLIRDPEKRKKMGEIGRKIVEEEFTMEKMIDRYEELCYDVVGFDNK